VDIEFMVQYAVLAWARDEPELARWTDNIRILETLGRAGRFPEPVVDALIAAYIAFRSASHRLALQQAPGEVALDDDVVAGRDAVLAQWEALFGGIEARSEAPADAGPQASGGRSRP
jgi:glutamate-ammonia-ligase adenylyltransferase